MFGFDGFGNKALKYFPVRARLHLLAIVNAIIHLWYFGNALTLLYYKSHVMRPGSHRIIDQWAISLKGLYSNFVLNHATQRLTKFCACRKCDWQLQYKEATKTSFFDVSNAFDKVWHEGLLSKLLHQNIHPHMTRLIIHFYNADNFMSN